MEHKTFEELMAEGSEAYHLGLTENPYPYMSWEWERWQRGYNNNLLGEANNVS